MGSVAMGEACSPIKADYEMPKWPIYSPMHRLNETEILRRNQTSLAAAELYLWTLTKTAGRNFKSI